MGWTFRGNQVRMSYMRRDGRRSTMHVYPSQAPVMSALVRWEDIYGW